MSVPGLVCLALLAATHASAAPKWKAFDRAELAAATRVVQPDADAEALFWEVRVTDELSMTEGVPRTVLDHYLRIKIFTDRGRESQSSVEIPHTDGAVISNVFARTIKSDGSIVELKNTDIFERTVVKIRGLRLRVTSFVVPAVETGAVIEYQWRELRMNSLAMYAPLECQREIPVQLVKYLIKPLDVPGFDYGIRVEAFNGQNTAFTQDKEERGFLITTMNNVAAFRSEPYMPPEHDVKPWLLLYYTPGGRPNDPTRFWKNFGAALSETAKSSWKVDGAVRGAAQAAVGTLTTVKEKIAALVEVCRKIRRTDLVDSAPSADRKAKANRSPGDVLARREGDAGDILMLFGALAQAAGLDVRLAMVPDRDEMAHPPAVAHAYFMTSRVAAVRDGTEWRFVNPANAYGQVGALTDGQEARAAILGDAKQALFASTDLSGAAASRRRRTVHVKVDASGGVEGEVVLAYSGHVAADVRRADRASTAEEREKSVRDFVQVRLPGAEVTAIRFDHLTDQDGDYTISAHVKAADYAQRTASRLFVAPAILQQNVPPAFTAAERRHIVSFPYAWTEEDRVVIELPDGYRADRFTDPGGIDAAGVASYRVSIEQTGERTISYTRTFAFGEGGRLEFPVSAYSAVKAFFDRVRELDRYTVTLRQASAAGR